MPGCDAPVDRDGRAEGEAAGDAPVRCRSPRRCRRSGPRSRCRTSAPFGEHEVGRALATSVSPSARRGGSWPWRRAPRRERRRPRAPATARRARALPRRRRRERQGSYEVASLRSPSALSSDGFHRLEEAVRLRRAEFLLRRYAPRVSRSFGSRPRSARAGRAGPPDGSGSAGRTPVACSTASGNFAGCAVARQTTGTLDAEAERRGRRAARRRCAGRRGSRARSRCGGSRRRSRRRSPAPARKPVCRGRLDRAEVAEPPEQLGGALAVAAEELEQEALVVRRHLDVHARAERRHDRLGDEVAALDPAGEDVVAVRRDDEPLDRRARSAGRTSRRGCCRSCPTARRRRTRPSRWAAAT